MKLRDYVIMFRMQLQKGEFEAAERTKLIIFEMIKA